MPTAAIELIPDLGLTGPPRVIERIGDIQRAIVGSLRAEIGSGQAVLADDRFAFAIIGATRTRTGYLFIAADGTVARSASFLGPLERLGQVPRPDPNAVVPPLTATCGRLAVGVLDPHTSLWTSDGAAPIAPAPAAPPGVVLSAAFTDAEHGMIVVDGGELFSTSDGAASFQRVDLGEAAASSVSCVDGGLRVTSSRGEIAFDPQARPAERPGSPSHALGDQALKALVVAAALHRYGALVAHEIGAVVTDDGRVLVPRDRALVPIELTSDAELAALTGERRCSGARWGDHYALLCSNEIVRVDAHTLRGQVVAQGSINVQGAMLASNGMHALGRCNSTLSASRTCVLAGDQVLELPVGRYEMIDGQRVWDFAAAFPPIGLHGDTAVVLREGPGEPRLLLTDPKTGEIRRSLRMSLPPGTPRFDHGSRGVTADGTTMFGVACPETKRSICDEAGRRVVQVALGDGDITSAPIPDGATRAGFSTPEHGVAVGRDASKLWLTYDRGVHWQTRDTGVGGIIRMPDDEVNYSLRGGVRCDLQRCVIDGRIAVSFAPRHAAADRVLASPADLPELPHRSGSRRKLVPVAVGAPRPATVVAVQDDFHLDDSGRTHYLRDSVDGTLRVTGAGDWEMEWHGLDWQGAYGPRHASGALPALGSAHAEYHLELATRYGVVVRYAGPRPAVVWIPANGRPVEIIDDLLVRAGRMGIIDDLLMLPDGTLAVLFSRQCEHEAARFYRLSHLGRDGHVIEQRTLYWSDDWRRAGSKTEAIALTGGVLGVQGATDDRRFPSWFIPIDAAMPRRALSVMEAEVDVPICRPGAPGPLTIVFDTEDYPQRGFLRGGPKMCLQAVELHPYDGQQVFVAASSHGDLRTTSYSPYGGYQDYRWVKQ